MSSSSKMFSKPPPDTKLNLIRGGNEFVDGSPSEKVQPKRRHVIHTKVGARFVYIVELEHRLVVD